MRWQIVLILFAFVSVASVPRVAPAASDVPTTLPTAPPAGVLQKTWDQMRAIDSAAAQVHTLVADFEQRKSTALLKQPMVSAGRVWAAGDRTRWETQTPAPTQMQVDAHQVVVYYPQQHAAEIYPMSGALAALTASPVPRLAGLLQQFSITPTDERSLLPAGVAPPVGAVAFRLTPLTPALQQHVQQVDVLIDARRGLVLQMTLVDGDGESTELRFSNFVINSTVTDAQLQVALPAGTNVTRPLENLGGDLP